MYISLNIKYLSLKRIFYNLFWDDTFGAGPRKRNKNKDFPFLLGPAQKLPPENKLTKICLKDKDLILKLLYIF